MKTKKKRKLGKILLIALCVCIAAGLLALGVDAWVRLSTRDQILTPEQAAADGEFDCILVLGCQVWVDGSPSRMLNDRINRGLELYRAGAAPKLLMSGDHGTISYDEVNAMKRIATDAGVPSADVFMDHAGFSTYESIYRARDVFQCKRVLIVSQDYHLYRALYCANALGLDACAVSAKQIRYRGQLYRDLREIAARNKDFVQCIFKPLPTFLGEAIPISGSGDETNDEYTETSAP